MYQTRLYSEEMFQMTTDSYGDPITIYGHTNDGDSPVSLLVNALGACISMCVQSFYAHRLSKTNLSIETDVKLTDNVDFMICLTLETDHRLTDSQEKELFLFIDNYCKVKKLLSSDLSFHYNLTFRTKEK